MDEPEIKQTENDFLYSDKDGISYFTKAKRIYKSTDYGTTFEEIVGGYESWGSSAIEIMHLLKLEDDTLLVWVKYWEDSMDKMTIWKSDINQEVFERKLTYPWEGNIPNSWTPRAYNGIIVSGDYHPGRTTADNRIKLSKDYGETWEFIYSAPESTSGRVWHFHDVTYDPYRSRIWVINGDFKENANVRYTDDFGGTWHTLGEQGEAPVQFTSCHPMPNCVLFGTDSPHLRGIYKYKEGAVVGDFVIEPLKIWTHGLELGTPVGRGAQMWDTGDVVYFTSLEQILTTDPVIVKLWATKDGYNVYNIWSSEPMVKGNVNRLSVVDINGFMIGRIVDNGVSNTIKFKVPIWNEI
jgi:hypothetical protein